MKKLILIIAIVLFASVVNSAVVTCDPQEGVVEYGLACDGNVNLTAGADASGAMLFDLVNWTGATNTWVQCIVVACAPAAVVDGATGFESEAMECSDPSSFNMRVPENQNPNAFKVK
jgi:hypothetical protein